VSDFYHDDPVEELSSERKKPKALFGSVLLLFAGGLFLNTTLAANINLNSGGRVEFGQGVSVTAACAEGSALTVTPQSEFRNEAGAGAYYVKSIQVSGIPSSCNGKDFDISLYDNDPNSDALPLFDTSKRVATVYNNAGTFEQGFQGTGSTISSASGAFTVTFISPLALSSNAMKVTLQSTEHKAWAEASISGGALGTYTCTILNTGTAKCWGSNTNGQLGDGTTTRRLTPTTVSGLSSGVSKISAGQSHTCAVLDTGAVKCWGLNSSGQLGDNSTTQRLTPVDVSNLSGVAAVSVGSQHSCALLRTGAVKCWGAGGRTGDGTNTQRSTPVDVSGLSSGVAAISAGHLHTCALLTTGAVRCWGADNRGELGNGPTGDTNAPGSVTGLSSGVIAISAGENRSCAVLSNGTAKCWGWNDLGGLGNGSTGDQGTPVDVLNVSSAIAISTGGEHSCVLLSTGTVKCFGRNDAGQVGDGTNIAKSSPVDVSNVSSAVAITTGRYYSCALLSNGTARCWGNNGDGALGDGTTSNRNTGTSVTGIP
jgi:alpha-tubulin suppressor-like RCC1 family protein